MPWMMRPAWADVGAPVPGCRLVAGAASEMRTYGRPWAGDRLGDRGLATPGAHEQQDLTRAACRRRCPAPPRRRALAQLAHGQEFEDLILYVLESVVILLEDLHGRFKSSDSSARLFHGSSAIVSR